MKKRNYKFYIRKSHRYLGIFIGIQFVFWTVGGLYFSWTDIKEIHGDHLRKEKGSLTLPANFVSPQAVVDEISRVNNASEITKIQVVEVLGESFYEIKYRTGDKQKTVLANAADGKFRQPVSEDEARKIAADALANPNTIKQVGYLTEENVGGHHEYREKPLPAWAVTFEDGSTVYLSAETGQIGALRTGAWRVFDFLWMLHTMDFKERDNINNYLLRGFSLLGIITVFSGFLLFFVSSQFFRRLFSAKTIDTNGGRTS